jgi:cytoskeletal protein RodZ
VLKSTRESSGLSLSEVSKDLDISELILTQIEEGSIGAFKDIFELKNYISNYAKYLGLNPDEVLDEFNEYMFEKTSKIPMEEIENAAKETAQKEFKDHRIATPYTKAAPITNNKKFVVMLIIIIVLIILAIIWSIKVVTINNTSVKMINYFTK